MIEPKFWQNKNANLSKILYPFSLIYSLLFFLNRKFSLAYRSKSIIVSVGNINVGGSGKTPTVCALAAYFHSRNFKVIIASRGYKGSNKFARKVLPIDDARIVGDEPLILCNFAPCYVGKDKRNLIKHIEKAEDPDLIILDDGLQNPTIVKDYKILVINGRKGFGNEKIIPAGPLRQDIKSGLKGIDQIILISEAADELRVKLPMNKLTKARVEMNDVILNKKLPYIAFMGIADPMRFLDSLDQLGILIVEKVIYPDHYYYSEKNLEYLKQKAEKMKAQLITTEKDYVRIPEKFKKNINILKISLRLESHEFLKEIERKIEENKID